MTRDLLRLAASAVVAHRLRSGLTMLGIVVGIVSVQLLTSLGEGTRSAILSEFTQFGTHLLSIEPGKFRTTGLPGAAGGTVKKLTLDDADAVARVPGVTRVAPLVFGTARVATVERGRNVFVYGTTDAVPDVWRFRVGVGSFLPGGDPRRPRPLAVLGPTLVRELFGTASPLGAKVRIGAHRFVVVGVMQPKGRFLGFDLDDAAYVPVASAQRLFDRDELAGMDVNFSPGLAGDTVAARVRSVLVARHGGEEDFTIVTQSEMLDVLGRVLSIVGVAVGGIGAVSLLVGAIGILTMMWIAVDERTHEIGLVRALGGTRRQVVVLFLAEAAILSTAGTLAGLAAGSLLGTALAAAVPAIPVKTPTGFLVGAPLAGLLIGLLAGVLPARRAAALDPIEALRAE